MTEQRKWPDNWEWVDKEERTPATEAEAAAMVAKIEDRLRKTEAAAMVAKIEDRLRKTEAAAEEFKRGPTNDEPDFDQIFEEVQRRYDRDGSKPPMQHCIEATRDTSWFKPEVDEATLVTRKMFARMEEVKGYTARSSDYHFGHADKENHFQTARAVIAEALAVPPDVEDAARWIFDKSGDWPDLAKASAQKLAEYALRGKQ